MQEENKRDNQELPKFAIGIHEVRMPNGEAGYELRSVNKGVPIEVVLTQLKCFLRKMNEDYYHQLFGD